MKRRVRQLYFDPFDACPTLAPGRVPLCWFDPLWICCRCTAQSTGKEKPETCYDCGGETVHRAGLECDTGNIVPLDPGEVTDGWR